MGSAISELLNPQCVVINGTFKSSEEVIRSIGQELFKLGFVKDSFVQAAIDREKIPLSPVLNPGQKLTSHYRDGRS